MSLLSRKIFQMRNTKIVPANSVFNFDIPKILGKPLEEIDAIIQDKEKQINKIIIPKKDGSPRHVIAPGKDLKYIQKSIYWKLFRRYKAHDAAHGFIAKRGIATNADLHVGAKSIGKIDISDFFDSIFRMAWGQRTRGVYSGQRIWSGLVFAPQKAG